MKDPVLNIFTNDRLVSTLACHDKFHLQIESSDLNRNEQWEAVGNFNHILAVFLVYTTGYDPKFTDQYTPEILLYMWAGFPSWGDPKNITTRAEFTRWFGVSILYALHMAEIVTSGIDNIHSSPSNNIPVP
jgi:hypothetical protein